MLRHLILGCALCALAVGSAPALTWDFQNANQLKEFKSVNGTWEIKDGAIKTPRAAPAQRALVGDESWTDYTIEAKVRIDDNNWAGIVFRAKSDFEYYVAYLNVPDNKSELWRHSAPNHDTRAAINSNFPAVKTVVERGKWMDVKIEIAGDVFKYTLNGQAQWQAQDGNYKNGRIGVWAWDSGASFDDLSVNGKGIPTGLSVQAKNKLATRWATLKQER